VRVRLLFVAVFAILSGVVHGQQQPPTFKSGVDLVRFDVRIVDDAGRPITDLRPEELEIREDGRVLPIVLFQRVTEPSDTYVEAAVRAVTAQVSSNEAFPRGHLYVLVFDQEHITPGNEQRARMAAEQFIKRRVRPADRIAVYALPGPGPQMGFTADKMRALNSLSNIRGAHQRSVSTPFGTLAIYEAHRLAQGDDLLAAQILERMARGAGTDLVGAGGDITPVGRAGGGGSGEDPSITRKLLQENARTIVNQTDAASRQFLQRLADMVAQFKDLEGRKTVVLFSEGFFQDNLSRELEAVAAAAAQSYAVFYTFDLNARTQSLTEAAPAEAALAMEIQSRLSPLSTLASETDGMMLIDAGSRTTEALDRIAQQAQDYYLVGFTPSDEARENRGKYRRVTIDVKRAGARVSSRTGYVMPPATTPADRKRAINSVLGAPFAQQGLKIDYTTYVLKAPQPGHHKVVLTLDTALPVRSQPADAADVVFVARDIRDGRVVASGTDTIPLPAAARQGSALGAATYRVQFNVPAGSYMMRMVVREPGGLVGSADRRIDVRPLNGPDITASDLVLGSSLGGLPVRPRVYTGDGLSGVLETYGRTAAQLEDLSVRLELRRAADNTPVITAPGEIGAPEDDIAGGMTRRVSFSLPLATIPPGEYVAHAIVSARGEVVAERVRQVDLLAGAAPAMTAAPAPTIVSPIEIMRGELARQYLRSLQQRATGTPAAETAVKALQGRWEEVEIALSTLAEPAGVTDALRGLMLFVREDFTGAAAALQKSFDRETHPLTAFFLGWAYDGAGDNRQALSAWRSAAHLDPKLISAHLALADGYLKASQPALAVQALRAGLAAMPESTELQNRLQQIDPIRR
jgi:VWFA-related protein